MDDKCDCGESEYIPPTAVEITFDAVDCETCQAIELQTKADALGDACCRELERLQSKRGKR